MTIRHAFSPSTTACRECPLRELDVFKDRGQSEVDFIEALKSGEIVVPAGVKILKEN